MEPNGRTGFLQRNLEQYKRGEDGDKARAGAHRHTKSTRRATEGPLDHNRRAHRLYGVASQQAGERIPGRNAPPHSTPDVLRRPKRH